MIDIPIFCAHTAMVPTEQLVPNPKNPNKHPEAQIKLLAKVIRAQGFRNPVVVSKRSGFVIKGHGRLEAAKLLEMAAVPVDYQEYANEAAEWADMIADNRIAELAETDKDDLKALLRELDGQIDLDLTGYDGDSLDDLLDRLETAEGDSDLHRQEGRNSLEGLHHRRMRRRHPVHRSSPQLLVARSTTARTFAS